MILAMGLLALSGGIAVVGPRVLCRLTGCARPLLAVLAVQVAGWSLLVTGGLAAGVLASPSLASAGWVPAALKSCLAPVYDVLVPATRTPLRVAAGAFLAVVTLRLVSCAAEQAVTTRRRRSRHRILLGLVAHRHPQIDAAVIEDATPTVYCLPGRGGQVVFTSAALTRLTAAERDAVFAHERAHLRGHHHLLIASAGLLARAFPGIVLFRRGREHTARLVEILADESAARSNGPRVVADALLVLADSAAPPATLAATAIAVADRIERLVSTHRRPRLTPVGLLLRAAAVTAAAGLLAGSPLLLLIAGHALFCPD